jgi:hypothetical protein
MPNLGKFRAATVPHPDSCAKAPNPGDASVVTLSCVDHDAQDRRIQVLWELEPEAYVKDADRWHGLGTQEFDKPDLFAAYLNSDGVDFRFQKVILGSALRGPCRSARVRPNRIPRRRRFR